MYTILVNGIFILIGIVLLSIVAIISLSVICALLLSLAIYANVIKIILTKYMQLKNPLSKA